MGLWSHGKPEDMQNDDSMCDDHDEQGETPKHCRREHEVGELLNHWNFKLYLLTFQLLTKLWLSLDANLFF